MLTDPSKLIAEYAAGKRDFCVDLIGANFDTVDLRGANLMSACLASTQFREANLEGTVLSGANLWYAQMQGANLRRAQLNLANMTGVNLEGADLTEATMERVCLDEAILTDATMTGTKLRGATIAHVDLDGVRLEEPILGDTHFVDVNLTPFCDAKAQHVAPSDVDFRSIVRSLHHPSLKDFLRATGMPAVFVEYMVDCARSLNPQIAFSLFQSTFLSYGTPDTEFARKLNSGLEAEGVTTFFFGDDAVPGEKLHRMMRKKINEHDRVILICSQSSLERSGVLNELEETLARESRDGGNAYLIPVMLDDHVLTRWAPKDPDTAQTVRDRVIADFRGHADATAFARELAKLTAALKKPQPHPLVHF